MKNLKLIFTAFAIVVLAGCQGSSNTPTPASPTACNTYPYNQYGQQAPGCVSPNGYNTAGYYNNGYNTGNANSNPCAIYYQQYGVMYYPQNVGGQIMCVASQ